MLRCCRARSLPLARPMTRSLHARVASVMPGMRSTESRPLLCRLFATKSYPTHTVINMPALSPTMTTGNIGTWHKKIGDEIAPGDVLVEIETDKAQMDFECQEEGYLAKILLGGGSKDVSVNTPMAILVENKDDVEKFKDYVVGAGAPASAAAAPAAKEAPKPAAAAAAPLPAAQIPPVLAAEPAPVVTPSETGRILASPVAKKLASERGIDLAQVQGTGPKNRITKYDVESFKGAAAPAAKETSTVSGGAIPVTPGAAFTDLPLTNMRKIIGKRLQESKSTIPHYYLTVEVQVDKLLEMRQQLNSLGKDQYKLSVNDFIVKASALSMKAVPEVNSAWMGESIRRFHGADISVAVSTPAGLITPIVPKVESLGLAAISNTIKDLATRARNNKLMPHEYQGGSFTISNLGMFGIKQFTAIINPPQSCILAVGTTDQKLVPDASQANGFRSVNTMHVTLSCDHRVVDGAVGAQWLKTFKEYLENPATLLL